jgi:hypothetical protein
MFDFQNIINSENMHKLNVRLYRNGTGVVYFDKFKDSPAPPGNNNNRDEPRQCVYKLSRTKIQSSTLAVWANKQSKYLLFLTFTFPFDLSNKNDPEENQKEQEKVAARIWKLTLDSLRNNYKVKNYVWIKEFQKNGRVHYHILIDRNRVGIENLQRTFNNHIYNVTGRRDYSNNSVRLGNNPIVKNPDRVKNYLSKYITKADITYYGKSYGVSGQYRLWKEIAIEDIISDICSGNYGQDNVHLRKDVKIIAVDSFYVLFKIDKYTDFDP